MMNLFNSKLSKILLLCLGFGKKSGNGSGQFNYYHDTDPIPHRSVNSFPLHHWSPWILRYESTTLVDL